MRTRSRRNGRFRALVVIAAVAIGGVLPGCGSADGDPVATEPSANPRAEFLNDGALRPVRMASGHALTYVLPTTGSQVLCQALPKQRWERLLGGRVGRWPSRPPAAGCQINDQHGFVVMLLREADDAFSVAGTVAGRPMKVDRNDGDGTEVTVALTDDALRPATREHRPTRHLLTLRSTDHGDPRAELDLVKRILGDLVPVLANDVEPLPAIDDRGRIAYTETPLAGGAEFIDLPTPVQGLQLCTLLQNEATLEIDAEEVVLSDAGECRLSGDDEDDNVTVAIDDSPDDQSTYRDQIAGRPAQIGDGEVYALVRLRDDVAVDLVVFAADPVDLAERLVPLLLG